MHTIKKTSKKNKVIRSFEFVVSGGIIFAFIKILELITNFFKLIEDKSIENQLFFSRIDLSKSNVELSLTTYIIFALAYLLIWGFVIYGFFQLIKISKQLNKGKIFNSNTSELFKKAGKAFVYFGFGTLLIDIAVLIIALTSNRLVDLLSIEIIIFIIFGYMMYFLSDVFNEGFIINEENELTI